jgi:hypothetical protein
MVRAGGNPIFGNLALFEISDLCFARLEPQRLPGVGKLGSWFFLLRDRTWF